MGQDQRAPRPTALERAQAAAFPDGEYVGQESFMRASEIRALAGQAGIGPGVSVLDLCCGIAGPGRMITAETGCQYLGVDQSAASLVTARELALAGGLSCRFSQVRIPPVPGDGRFDVVLLLETMLAFASKEALVGEVARVLEPGGRFAFTVEEGRPLSAGERSQMPAADTVWPIPLADLASVLRGAGLTEIWRQDWSSAHQAAASSLLGRYEASFSSIVGQLGPSAAGDLVASHRLWSDWLGSGRVRKFAIVARLG